MKLRNLAHLAVVIVIGLEKLLFSVAFEEEYEFPFKMPFHDSGAHRSFPMQVKYMKEIMHGSPILQKRTNLEPTIINGNLEVNKQPEELEPQVEIAKLPTEGKEIRSHYEVVKESMYGEHEEVAKKHSIKKDSPVEYRLDEDEDSIESDLDDEELEDDEDLEDDDEEDEDEEAEVSTLRVIVQGLKREEPPTFPYRLTLMIMGPGDQVLRHEKTGSISAALDGSFKKDDMNSLLQYMRDTQHRECTRPKVADAVVVGKTDKSQYPVHISPPAIRYSSQTMDQHGNILRHERMRPLPIAMMGYYKNSAFKSVQEPATPESLVVKVVTSEPRVAIINEIAPQKVKFGKEARLTEVGKHLKPANANSFPKKYDTSVNFHENGHNSDDAFKLEGSALKVPDEDDDEEVKESFIIRPDLREFHASMDLDGNSRTGEKVVKVGAASEEMPVKKIVTSDKSQFSFRQFWAPLRQVLVSKIFGRPNVDNHDA